MGVSRETFRGVYYDKNIHIIIWDFYPILETIDQSITHLTDIHISLYLKELAVLSDYIII